MKKLIKFALYSVVGLLVLAWVGTQAYLHFKSIKTEVAVSFVMSNNTTVQGVIIRDEQVINADNNGFYHYLVPNGSKVSKGQKLAAVHGSEESLIKTQKMEELKQQKSILQQVSQQAYADLTPEQVTDEIAALIAENNTTFAQNNYSDAAVFKTSLLAQISRRIQSMGGSVDFSAQIAAVDAEIKALGDTGSNKYEKAPCSGYFSAGSDGLESVLNLDSVSTITAADIKKIAESAPTDNGSFGRIVKSFKWYVAAVVPADALKWIEDTKTVYLQFVGTHNESIKGSVYRIEEEADGSALVVIRCDNITSSLVNMRLQSVIISSFVQRGVRFPARALHIVDGNQGVYVKEGNVMRFKLIEILAQDENFILSEIKEGEDAQDYLNVFDEIIVSGEDLHDGKRITG